MTTTSVTNYNHTTKDNYNKWLNDFRAMCDKHPDRLLQVVDKGTLDAVLCGEDSREGSAQLLAAALRVLKKKGVLLIVSHSKARAALIPPGAWKVATHDVAAPALDDAKPATTHYVYACTKIA